MDYLRDISLSSDANGPIEVVRSVRVGGLTFTDYRALDEAITASGIPDYNDPLGIYPNLYLVAKNANVLPESPDVADVTLRYARKPFTQGQIVVRRAAAVQSTTRDVDAFNNPVAVLHTFGNGDPNYPGMTQQYKVDLNVLEAIRRRTISTVIETDVPEFVVAELLGKVNSKPWGGDPERTWFCEDANVDPIDEESSPGVYSFVFSFRHAEPPLGFDLKTFFSDWRVGRSPVGLVLNQGIKTIQVYRSVDFNERFPL